MRPGKGTLCYKPEGLRGADTHTHTEKHTHTERDTHTHRDVSPDVSNQEVEDGSASLALALGPGQRQLRVGHGGHGGLGGGRRGHAHLWRTHRGMMRNYTWNMEHELESNHWVGGWIDGCVDGKMDG